jgi:hypothetical protein
MIFVACQNYHDYNLIMMCYYTNCELETCTDIITVYLVCRLLLGNIVILLKL